MVFEGGKNHPSFYSGNSKDDVFLMPKSEKTLLFSCWSMTSSNKHHVWQINSCKSLCYNKSIVQVFTASYHVQCQLSVVPKLPNSNFHIGRIARCIDRSDSLRRNPSGKSFNGEQPRSHRKNGSQPTNQRPTTQHDTKTTSNSAGI